jgi:hypothetical protein
MDPIVVRGPFQCLSWIDWAVELLLSLAIILGRFDGSVTILPLFFLLLFRLLLVANFGRLNKIVFSVLDGTQNTLVFLCGC